MSKRCRWRGGCTTVLSQYNKGDQCFIHQSMSAQITYGMRSAPMSAAAADRPEKPRRKSFSAAKPVVTSEQLRRQADKVAEAVCLEFGVPKEDITWEHENPAMHLAKNVIAYILKRDLGMTLREIQEYLKRSASPSAVYYHLTRITSMIINDRELAERVEKIRLSISRASQLEQPTPSEGSSPLP